MPMCSVGLTIRDLANTLQMTLTQNQVAALGASLGSVCEELREGQGKGGGKKQPPELRAVLSPQDRASRLDRCAVDHV